MTVTTRESEPARQHCLCITPAPCVLQKQGEALQRNVCRAGIWRFQKTLSNLQAKLVSVTANRVNITGISFCSLLRRDRSVWMKCCAVFLVCLSKLLEYIWLHARLILFFGILFLPSNLIKLKWQSDVSRVCGCLCACEDSGMWIGGSGAGQSILAVLTINLDRDCCCLAPEHASLVRYRTFNVTWSTDGGRL